MDSNKDFNKLKSLVNEVFGVKDISYDTEINNLKTLSEDNDRFIELFQSEFNINMSSFPYYQYFEEDEFIILSLIKRVFRRNMKDKKSLSVSHLLKVIEKGEWFE
ncbi:DUF1493 family protein [Schleiferia thermophila]|jgi:hypothetical protein|uniref:Uncharacterized protein DUF1493 n=1 Tax=Schleiferia thermophila TaxID=884107 RepID=A0A368ZYX7_9FLAO|nr:DUF1493 family protein [Schleiferia thermophila]KFD38223.1 hypothetical protein AT05_11110 [Schleiferia thermophila str. Yellowstone]PMB13029.1 DUF1493 domain-containing protein [Fischerella thermalis CCMEE 5319]RCX02165.1 uncharacterized protein DUF1493 [Schleiferia thermophila]GCD80686.1 hypothetical protein JCM30197_19330 [Schleiferia thermophila]